MADRQRLLQRLRPPAATSTCWRPSATGPDACSSPLPTWSPMPRPPWPCSSAGSPSSSAWATVNEAAVDPGMAVHQPIALVAQDGLERLPVPWEHLQAVFIGGSSQWKLGPHATSLVREAKERSKWVHGSTRSTAAGSPVIPGPACPWAWPLSPVPPNRPSCEAVCEDLVSRARRSIGCRADLPSLQGGLAAGVL
jgi:hypothetical protein